MERKTVSQAPIYVRDAVNRAAQFAASKNYDGAISTLLPIIRRHPEVALLFDKIRDYETAKLRTQGGGAKFLALLGAIFKAPFILMAAIADPVKAIAMCENSLAKYVDNPIILGLLCNAANSADAPWAVVSALSVSCKLHPGNTQKMRQLADAMQRNGQALDALKIHQELLKKLPPSSLAEQAELREAMALASIERGKFNDKKSNKANTADAEDAIIQQLLEGTIHDAGQAQLLIDRFNAELKQKDSIDMRRKLADAYMVAERYEEALQEYRNVADKLGVMDPVLDKHIEKAYIAQLQQSISMLKSNPEAYESPEEQIADLERECVAYRWRHTQQRAQQFPNDMQLQFDLGELQFKSNMIDDAIATFTRVADNPQKRRNSLVYLGRCALLRNEPVKAAENLNEALKEMYRMDKYKRETLYYLGHAYEMLQENEKAVGCYKQINVNMSNYRDVPQRIAALSGDTAIELSPLDGVAGGDEEENINQ